MHVAAEGGAPLTTPGRRRAKRPCVRKTEPISCHLLIAGAASMQGGCWRPIISKPNLDWYSFPETQPSWTDPLTRVMPQFKVGSRKAGRAGRDICYGNAETPGCCWLLEPRARYLCGAYRDPGDIYLLRLVSAANPSYKSCSGIGLCVILTASCLR